MIVFHKGAHAKWHVEGYVRKVAFLCLSYPFPFGIAIRAVNKLKSFIARHGPVTAAACIIVAE